MKNKLVISLIMAVILFTAPAPALAWGSATHNYLAKELGNKFGIMNLQEMYGSVLPDLFNLMFGYPYQDYLWTETHYEFMKLVSLGKFGRKKACAYGFASHNDEWGADYTAHHSAVLNPEEGYVVTKVNYLAPSLEPEVINALIAAGIPQAQAETIAGELTPGLADNCVESAVDYLVSQNEDNKVGYRMMIAAKYRSPFVPFLLSQAYAKDFASEAGITFLEATVIVFEVEKQFKEYIELYGKTLMQANAKELMAEMGARLAEEKLYSEYEIAVEVPSALILNCLNGAINVVEGDYSDELAATLDFVDDNLEGHGIETFSW